MGGEQDIRKMGGLRSKMPLTYLTFLAATLAISGIPPFSGFFSKDMILSKAFEHSPVLYALGLGTALITCFYMFRLLYLVFFGENRLAGAHPHESPKVMTVPLMVLAVLSVIGGFLNIPALFGGNLSFSNYLQSAVASKATEEMSHSTEIGLIVLSVVLLAGIIYWAFQTFVKKAEIPSGDEVELPTLPRVITNKFYIDEIYRAVFEKPFGYLSDFLFKKVESTVLAPAVEEVGTLTAQLGALTRKLQRGNMSFYLFAMVAGILLFVVFILLI